MTELAIVVSPAFDRRGRRRHDRFDAVLKDSAERIIEATRQPLLDAARVMLDRGVDPSTVICMVHSHTPTVVAMRAPIGVAGQYDVMGEKFVRRKRDAGPMSGSVIENRLSSGPVVPGSTNATPGASYNGSLQPTSPTTAISSTTTHCQRPRQSTSCHGEAVGGSGRNQA
jgi:hypothetical protein